MGAFFLELKPLAVVIAVVLIVWLTAMSDAEPQRSAEPTYSAIEFDRWVEAGRDLEPWDEGWGLANVEVEAE